MILAVRMAVSARTWVETPIEVVDAGLHRSSTGDDGTAVSEARVSYRYRFGGSSYTGHRIGVAARALVARGRLRRRGIERGSRLRRRPQPDP